MYEQKKHISLKDLQKSELWHSLEPLFLSGIKNARQLLFHYKNNLINVPTCRCGKNLGWHPDKREYRKYCSQRCTGIYSVETVKKQNLLELGVEWHSQLPEWRNKVKKTSLKKFGKEHYSQTDDFLDRIKQTNLEKFGTNYAIQNITIQSKMKKTCQEKYGGNSPLSSITIRDKGKETNLLRYGFKNPMSNINIQAKLKQSNLTKYQAEYPMQNSEISCKSIETRIKNHYSPEVLSKINDPQWLFEQNQSLTLSEISKNLGVLHNNICKHFARFNLDIKYHSVTELERKFLNYFSSKNINIQLKNRSIISPMEIDVVFPDIKLGIEINGGYYHSEEFKPDKNYHLNKVISANRNGYDLWHFWDWEVNNNWDLIISKIENRFGLSNRIYARKLKIGLVNYFEKEEFLRQHHLQQSCQSTVNLGLYNNLGELLMIGTFGRSRFSKKIQWEMLRLASKKGLAVIGGASKIVNYFLKNYMINEESLVSYCQRRFSNGNVYRKLGFIESHITGPGFSYVKSGILVGSRIQWQKHKLKEKLSIFNEKISANDNMKANRYYRVWDCGQIVFKLSKLNYEE